MWAGRVGRTGRRQARAYRWLHYRLSRPEAGDDDRQNDQTSPCLDLRHQQRIHWPQIVTCQVHHSPSVHCRTLSANAYLCQRVIDFDFNNNEKLRYHRWTAQNAMSAHILLAAAQWYEQEAQLPQRDSATRYASKSVLRFTSYGSYKGFKQQKWPSSALAMVAFDRPHTISY